MGITPDDSEVGPLLRKQARAGVSFEEAITAVGFGRFQYLLLVVCGAGLMTDMLELTVQGILLPVLTKEWGISSTAAAALASATYGGMLLGSFCSGALADSWGRKPVFVTSLAIGLLATLASALSSNWSQLLWWRFCVGVGVGGNLPVSTSMFVEFMPTSLRGLHTSLMVLAAPLGVIIMAAVQLYALPVIGWRWMVVLLALPSTVALAGLTVIPESPRFLLIAGRTGQAMAVLDRIAEANGNEPAPPLAGLTEEQLDAARKHTPVTELFNARFRSLTVKLWLLWFWLEAACSTFGVWCPTLLQQLVGANSMPVVYFWISLVGSLLGTGILLACVAATARPRLLLAALLLATVATPALCFAPDVMGVVLAGAAQQAGTTIVWGMIGLFTLELYPTVMRGVGLGCAYGICRVAALFMPLVGGAMLTDLSAAAVCSVLWMVAACLLVAAAVVATMEKDMRGQPLTDTARNRVGESDSVE